MSVPIVNPSKEPGRKPSFQSFLLSSKPLIGWIKLPAWNSFVITPGHITNRSGISFAAATVFKRVR
ncbi:hypothetical protein D3C84_1209080 [compost metagenome]